MAWHKKKSEGLRDRESSTIARQECERGGERKKERERDRESCVLVSVVLCLSSTTLGTVS